MFSAFQIERPYILSLLPRYLINRLWELHQIYSLAYVHLGTGTKINRLHFEVKRSQVKVKARTDELFR